MSAKKTPAPAPVAAATGFDPAAMMAAMGPMAAMFQALLAQPRQPVTAVTADNVDTFEGVLAVTVRAWKEGEKARADASDATKKEYGSLRKLATWLVDKLGPEWVKPGNEVGTQTLSEIAAAFRNAGHSNPSVVRARVLSYGINVVNQRERAAAEKAGREANLVEDPNADKRTPAEKARASLADMWYRLESIEEPDADTVKLKASLMKLTSKAERDDAAKRAEKRKPAKPAPAAPAAPAAPL